MAEQLLGPFEKFVDWWQCATVMLLYLPLHNSSSLVPVHELFERPTSVFLHQWKSRKVCQDRQFPRPTFEHGTSEM